jgi:hypothetical protein
VRDLLWCETEEILAVSAVTLTAFISAQQSEHSLIIGAVTDPKARNDTSDALAQPALNAS